MGITTANFTTGAYDAFVMFDVSGHYGVIQIADKTAQNTTCVRGHSDFIGDDALCVPVTLPGSYLLSENMNMTSGSGFYGTYASGGTVSGTQFQNCQVTFSSGGGGTGYIWLSGTNTLSGSLVTGVPTTVWSSTPTTGTLSNGLKLPRLLVRPHVRGRPLFRVHRFPAC